MPRIERQHGPHVCPKTGKPVQASAPRSRWRWLIWLYPLIGLVSLVWFLLRVVPKPSRAGYPCQKAAAPLAASFVAWTVGVLGSIVAFHRARSLMHRSRYAVAAMAFMIGLAGVYLTVTNTPGESAEALPTEGRYDVNTPNQPLGVAKGLHPGRVVWVHDPDASQWTPPDLYDDYNDSYWWEAGNTDQAVVDTMMSNAVQWLAGESTDVEAWDALFVHFNEERGFGSVGYQAGDKIAIKINLTVANVGTYNTVDNAGNQQNSLWSNSVTVEAVHALLDQLVNVAGVPEADISIGDSTCYFPSREYNYLSASFPDVNYMSGRDGKLLSGRPRIQTSTVTLDFSEPGASGAQDYLPRYYADAKYFINFAILKAHSAAVTLCAKNHYGSLSRRPVDSGYYDMHNSLPYLQPNMGSYRALVDLMGHKDTGGKTLLYLLDGIWGGYNWGGTCPPVKWRMAPFNGDHPNSIFMSQDPVAIDSVGFDFWWEEDKVSWDYYPFNGKKDAYGFGSVTPHFPHLSGGTDFLIEAASAGAPPSGTIYNPDGTGRLESLGVYEHWNNATDKEYSRNLGIGDGIELVTGPPPAPPTEVVARRVFYNNSDFDDNDPAPNAADDGAIAPDKTPLLFGQTATFANYTSYSKGINGVMIDIQSLAGTPTAADFNLSVGDGATWTAAPTPTITIRPGAGVGGSDRITLIWPDGAIVNCWLRVAVMPTVETGLPGIDFSFVGNAIGETGDSPADACVTAADADGCADNCVGLSLDDFVTLKQNFGQGGMDFADGDYDRDNDVDLDDFVILKNAFGGAAAIDNPYDFNRDGRVAVEDFSAAETNAGTCLDLLAL